MTGSVIDKTVICREAEHIKELFRGEINEAENELIAYVEEGKNRPVETQEGRRAADEKKLDDNISQDIQWKENKR